MNKDRTLLLRNGWRHAETFGQATLQGRRRCDTATAAAIGAGQRHRLRRAERDAAHNARRVTAASADAANGPPWSDVAKIGWRSTTIYYVLPWKLLLGLWLLRLVLLRLMLMMMMAHDGI